MQLGTAIPVLRLIGLFAPAGRVLVRIPNKLKMSLKNFWNWNMISFGQAVVSGIGL
jgi:hypothetical protein